MKEEGEWILPKDHQGRKRRNAEDTVRCDKKINRNRHHELCEKDIDGKEDEGCPMKFNDIEIERNAKNNEELTEHEHE